MRIGRSLHAAPVFALLLLSAQALAAIPARPSGDAVILDTAGLLDADDRRLVESVQRSTLAADGVSIVVVTVSTIAAHAPGENIEGLARSWFDQWGIGSEHPNLGILLLISEQDRKARIELGAGWGRRWDGYARTVMREEIVPGFRADTPSVAILRGVVALSAMAGLDPAAAPVAKAVPPGPAPVQGTQAGEIEAMLAGAIFGSLLCFLAFVTWLGRRDRKERGGKPSPASDSSWLSDGGGAGFGSGIDWGSAGGGGFSGGGGSSGGGGATGGW